MNWCPRQPLYSIHLSLRNLSASAVCTTALQLDLLSLEANKNNLPTANGCRYIGADKACPSSVFLCSLYFGEAITSLDDSALHFDCLLCRFQRDDLIDQMQTARVIIIQIYCGPTRTTVTVAQGYLWHFLPLQVSSRPELLENNHSRWAISCNLSIGAGRIRAIAVSRPVLANLFFWSWRYFGHTYLHATAKNKRHSVYVLDPETLIQIVFTRWMWLIMDGQTRMRGK